MHLGILGGSFDPVHRGHVAVAEAARDRLGCDRVLLVVAAGQPLKPGGPVAPGEDRYAMVRLAVRGLPGLEASDLELRRPAPSYTVDTLREIRADAPPGTEITLLLGADAARDLPRWREGAAIPGLARVVIVRRAGFPAPPPGVATLDAGAPEAASSGIRSLLAAGLPVADLLPADVEAYIRARGLYGAA